MMIARMVSSRSMQPGLEFLHSTIGIMIEFLHPMREAVHILPATIYPGDGRQDGRLRAFK